MNSRRTFSAASGASLKRVTHSWSSSKRQSMLLHGAWHGDWRWNRWPSRYVRRATALYTPTQTGLDERSHLISKNVTPDVFVQDLRVQELVAIGEVPIVCV